MHTVTDEEFQRMITKAMDELSKQLVHLENVAILVEDEPSSEQRQLLHLHDGTLLFGLYEGVPLPRRGGTKPMLPDKITLFKHPIEAICQNREQVQEQIKRTLWHELAHYYGLDHKRINELQ